MGQEMYKLMLIQTLAEVGSILLVEGAHWVFIKLSSRYFIRLGMLVERLVSIATPGEGGSYLLCHY